MNDAREDYPHITGNPQQAISLWYSLPHLDDGLCMRLLHARRHTLHGSL